MTEEEKYNKAEAFGEWLVALSAKRRWAFLADEEERGRLLEFVDSRLPEILRTLPDWHESESPFDVTASSCWHEAQGYLLSNTVNLDAEETELAVECMQLMDLFCQEQERLHYIKSRKKKRLITTHSQPYTYQDPLTPAATPEEDSVMEEGALRQVSITTKERNRNARQACLRKYGDQAYICQACGFDFEKFYGLKGREYIEVHHLNPIAAIDGAHEIDSAEGLVPLCSNCHSMIHRAGPNILRPITLEALKELINANGRHREENTDY